MSIVERTDSIIENDDRELHIGPHSNGMLMEPWEYDELPDDCWKQGYRYELLHGVLVVSPPASIGERSPNNLLGYLILSYKEEHPNGSLVDDAAQEQEIQCGDDRRRADHAIWIGLGRAPQPLEDTPTIAVEFVSDSSRDRTRDYIEKRKEYALAGVQEYWVIDRFSRELVVFRGAHEDNEQIVVPEGRVYETPLLPGFQLPLDKLLAKADQYTKPEKS